MYSSVVRLELVVDDHSYPLAKIAPSHIVFREPVELPPCRGEILMHVDDRTERWSVVLTHGTTPIDFKTPIVRPAAVATE